MDCGEPEIVRDSSGLKMFCDAVFLSTPGAEAVSSVNNELTSVVLQRYFACMQFTSANSCCCRGDILAGRAGHAREQLI
jgi:hypothetical protein